MLIIVFKFYCSYSTKSLLNDNDFLKVSTSADVLNTAVLTNTNNYQQNIIKKLSFSNNNLSNNIHEDLSINSNGMWFFFCIFNKN